jgi:hypothetical protein
MTQPLNSVTTKEGRRYVWPVTGETFTSVTTAISALGKQEVLMPWAAKLAASYALDHIDEIIGLIRELKYKEAHFLIKNAYERDRGKKAAIGSVVHNAIDAFILHGGTDLTSFLEPSINSFLMSNPDYKLGLEPGEVIAYLAGYEKFYEEIKPKYLLSEATVYSRLYGYAGTMDGLIEMPSGDRLLIDVKTGTFLYSETALQLAAYRYADFLGGEDLIERPVPEVDGCGVLHVRPNKADLVPIRCDEEMFDYFTSALKMRHWKDVVSKNVWGRKIHPPTF